MYGYRGITRLALNCRNMEKTTETMYDLLNDTGEEEDG